MDRIKNAADSLHGLALGDAFGQRWFFRKGDELDAALRRRQTPEETPWHWTDDTAMALSVLRELHLRGEIDQDALAERFASAYTADPYRGYGGSMHGVLKDIQEGESWGEVTRRQFGGQGSYGNGSAMRVAPLGAWFADDLDAVAAQARLSAQVTHAHPEADAGAVAVAVAAALAVRSRGAHAPSASAFLTVVADATPESDVQSGLRTAARFDRDTSVVHAVSVLGNGLQMSNADTVPFALWSAAWNLDSLEDALWTTATGMGDVDTTCAIAGGVVAARTGLDGIRATWVRACEPVPDWVDSGGTL